jgi:hypothetical protein
MRKPKFLKVHWHDAQSVDGWTFKSDIEPSLAMVVTLGHLVKEDVDTVVIALNHDETNDSYSCFINIPKKWIVQRKTVKA